jgi:hypothetical protein
MPDDDPEYPLECADTSFASIFGEINGFAGTENSGDKNGVPAGANQKGLNALTSAFGQAIPPIPVLITGSRNPKPETIPGLREAMIASAVLRLAAQLPASSSANSAELRAAGLRLLGLGGQKIVEFSKRASRTPKKA